MQLNELHDGPRSNVTLYKGIYLGDYKNYECSVGNTGTTIPGFLGSYDTARIYSEPNLTSQKGDSPTLIISVQINESEVEDLTAEFIEWVNAKHTGKTPEQRARLGYDVAGGFPVEWRDGRVWTVKSNEHAHGTHSIGLSQWEWADFVFCGVKKQYMIVAQYDNQGEWTTGSTSASAPDWK